jgi:hypothetical protein
VAGRLTDRSDKLLIKLDREHGLNAVYHRFGEPVVDVETGEITTPDNPIPVKIRAKGLSSFDISQLSSAGFGNIDAVWLMRYAYKSDVQSNDVISVNAFDYEVIDQGASLDSLRLLWTIFTRRRR